MKKNVIVICIDGCRLDRAKSSPIFKNFLPGTVFFSQAITYAPYTNSAIHALISGCYGNRNGCFSYWHSHNFKNKKFKTLASYFQENNYFTCADIHSDLVIPNKGFEQFNVFDESIIDLQSRHSELIDLMKSKFDNGENFFLYLHYSSIHTEIMNSVLKVYNNFSKEYFDNKELNEKRYDTLFLNAENYLKTIFNKLKEFSLVQDTIILVISDHGTSIGEKIGERAYGAFCYDYTIKTFATYISSNFNEQEITKQVRHVDFMPTILEHVGLKPDNDFEPFDGISLIPLIEGKNFDEKIAYTETANPLKDNAPPKKPNTKSVRTSQWKLIFNEHNNTKELYNLKDDPNETKNLIDDGLEIEEILWNELVNLQTAYEN